LVWVSDKFQIRFILQVSLYRTEPLFCSRWIGSSFSECRPSPATRSGLPSRKCTRAFLRTNCFHDTDSSL
jgi:hypothetical protein